MTFYSPTIHVDPTGLTFHFSGTGGQTHTYFFPLSAPLLYRLTDSANNHEIRGTVYNLIYDYIQPEIEEKQNAKAE